MKKIFSLAVMASLLGAAAAFSSEGTRVRNWNNVQTYDVAAVQKNLAAQRGKVVGVRCNFSGKDIRHMKPNWYVSSIWQKSPSGNGFVDLRVMVAKKDLPAFKSITTEPGGTDMAPLRTSGARCGSEFPFRSPAGPDSKRRSSGNATIT
jgi:hypothetical protein